jgi:hypothetical protein
MHILPRSTVAAIGSMAMFLGFVTGIALPFVGYPDLTWLLVVTTCFLVFPLHRRRTYVSTGWAVASAVFGVTLAITSSLALIL